VPFEWFEQRTETLQLTAELTGVNVPFEWFEQRTETLQLTAELTGVNVQCSVDTFRFRYTLDLTKKIAWSPDQFFTHLLSILLRHFGAI
jgi:hypothetical protein